MSVFYRLGEFVINLDNVQYVERRKVQGISYLDISFVGKDQPMIINEIDPKGKALLNWWQNEVRVIPGGSEELVNLYASS
jgi:hypothetical protein